MGPASFVRSKVVKLFVTNIKIVNIDLLNNSSSQILHNIFVNSGLWKIKSFINFG